MIVKVSHVSGTFGMNSSGRLRGSSPLSPTAGTLIEKTTAAAVTRAIETSGAGMTLVIFGMRTMISSPTATRG